MKIVNIFGLVVAVHVAVLILVFAIPGCRSTGRPADASAGAVPVVATTSAEVISPIQPAREMSPADLNPPVSQSRVAGAPNFDPNAPATAAGGGRFSPQRPGSTTSVPTASTSAPAATAATYTVARGDSLWSIAKKHATTVRELSAANNLRPDTTLKLGQQLVIPGGTVLPPASAGGATITAGAAVSAPKAAAATPAGSSESTTYVVRAGDTLGAIARRHSTTVAAIKALNNLRSDMVRVGDSLAIPGAATAAGATSVATPPASVPAAAPSAAAPSASLARAGSGSVKHVVAPGESLGAIARRYNVRLGDLAMANNIADPTKLRPGQELIVPGVTTPDAAPKAPVPTQYPSSFPETQAPAGVIYTEDADNVPVIRVEENVPTIRVEPAPAGGTPPPSSENPGAPIFR